MKSCRLRLVARFTSGGETSRFGQYRGRRRWRPDGGAGLAPVGVGVRGRRGETRERSSRRDRLRRRGGQSVAGHGRSEPRRGCRHFGPACGVAERNRVCRSRSARAVVWVWTQAWGRRRRRWRSRLGGRRRGVCDQWRRRARGRGPRQQSGIGCSVACDVAYAYTAEKRDLAVPAEVGYNDHYTEGGRSMIFTPDYVKARLREQPFVPVRIVTTTGQTLRYLPPGSRPRDRGVSDGGPAQRQKPHRGRWPALPVSPSPTSPNSATCRARSPLRPTVLRPDAGCYFGGPGGAGGVCIAFSRSSCSFRSCSSRVSRFSGGFGGSAGLVARASPSAGAAARPPWAAAARRCAAPSRRRYAPPARRPSSPRPGRRCSCAARPGWSCPRPA